MTKAIMIVTIMVAMLIGVFLNSRYNGGKMASGRVPNSYGVKHISEIQQVETPAHSLPTEDNPAYIRVGLEPVEIPICVPPDKDFYTLTRDGKPYRFKDKDWSEEEGYVYVGVGMENIFMKSQIFTPIISLTDVPPGTKATIAYYVKDKTKR